VIITNLKQSDREKIKKDIRLFLKRGGRIQSISMRVRNPDTKHFNTKKSPQGGTGHSPKR
jgi:hypothetical protein